MLLYCYSLLYPYIYCNPYLLSYILKKNEQELIDFLNTIISNILLPDYDDKKEPIPENNFIIPNSISDDEINNLYSEELLYYLNDNNKLPNMEKEIDNYEIYTNKLVEKLEYFVENIRDKSLLEKKIVVPIIQDDLELTNNEELPEAHESSSEPKSPKRKVENIQERPVTPIKQLQEEQEIKDTPESPYGKRQKRITTNIGGKNSKTKIKNKTKNKKTKKKYKSKSKIVYKKKNTKKRITKKKKINKKVKNTKKKKNKN